MFETAHFAYFSDELPCPELGEWMEHDYESTTAYLGIETERRKTIEHHHVSASEVDAFCTTPGAEACFGDDAIYATAWYNRHEATHALTNDFGTPPPPFFHEGLAWMLAPEWGDSLDTPIERSETVTEKNDATSPTQLRYSTAGAFTLYLVDRFGIDRFMDFYRSVGAGVSEDELESAGLIVQQ